jgi:nicotinate dehydrogenase subunit B
MHAGMGASAAVADFRADPDQETGIQLTLYSGTQNVTAPRDTVARLLEIDAALVRVLYEEASGCYGHNGADDCAADAALLSEAVRRPVRVQWRRQDEHGWEPLGAAMAHDVEGVVDASGITAWLHRIYALTANSRPASSAPGSLLAGELSGLPPANLPTGIRNTSGRNAPVTYGFPRQRVEGKLVKSFDTSTGGRPASPLRHRFPRTTALRLARWLLELVRQRVVLRRARARRRVRPARAAHRLAARPGEEGRLRGAAPGMALAAARR